MEEFRVLKFLDKIKAIFENLGIDYKTMRRILQIKLTMDQRRVPTIISNYKQGEEKNSFRRALLFYGIMGLFIMVVMLIPIPIFLKLNSVFGIVIFLVMTTMISDFSSVLLDVRDKNILLPRPVDPKTINAAKILHIFIYLFKITFTIAGPSLIAGTIKHGIVFFPVFAIELILISGFVLFITSLLYFLILLFFDGEKLKDLINYVQILLSIIMLVAYQFMGQIFQLFDIQAKFTPKWWVYLIPSTWFAAPFGLIFEKGINNSYIILTVVSVIIPILAFILYFKAVVPHFEQSLQKLNNNYSRRAKSAEKKAIRRRKLAEILCGDKVESAFYSFTENMISNERKFKLKTYPSLALGAFMPFIIIGREILSSKNIHEGFINATSGRLYLSEYLTVMLLAVCIVMIVYTEKYKAAWIYKALPLQSPVAINKGAFKAFFVKIIFPMYLFVSVLFIALFGIKIIPDIIFMFFTLILTTILIYRMAKKGLPFYKDFPTSQNSENVGATFGVMGIIGIIALIHAIVLKGILALSIGSFVVLLLIIILWRGTFNIEWKDIFNE